MPNNLPNIAVGKRTFTPSKIICIGRNYVEHIEELKNEIPDEMVVFIKPNSAISDQLYSFKQEQLHYEAEICFLVENGQLSAVGFGLDITKRHLQGKLKSKGLPWEKAKAFDGSAIFSPFKAITQVDESLALELKINGEIVQTGDISLMMYKPNTILQELARFLTVNDGDIIMTGTPKGVGTINSGDTFTGKISCQRDTIVSAEWKAT